jgi:hypothetical protein
MRSAATLRRAGPTGVRIPRVEDEAIGDIAAPPPMRRPAWIARLVVESALIVLSVLVALAVDEWRDDRAMRARSREAVAAIVAEINANKKAAQSATQHHDKVHAELKAMVAANAVTVDALSRGVFKPAVLLEAAWVTARDTGALAPLPLDVVLRLSRLYERQAKYTELASSIGEDFYVDLRRRGASAVLLDSVPGFGALTADFAGREAGLVAGYDEALQALASVQ